MIPSGNTTCTTEAFSALGWHWSANGVAQNTRVVQAFKANGELIASSNQITVAPRPVVMVHGLISYWETWKPYLSETGFLAPLGISGFAVGDGQVLGKLNTGDMLKPTERTNTIGQKIVMKPFIKSVHLFLLLGLLCVSCDKNEMSQDSDYMSLDNIMAFVVVKNV